MLALCILRLIYMAISQHKDMPLIIRLMYNDSA
jgi:hypothetical protein